jgi:hypothetical protein
MELHRLIVKISADMADLERGLADAQHGLSQAGDRMMGVGRKLSLGVTLPLAAIGTASVKMASDAEESANKFNVVMGDSADRVNAKLRQLHDTIPLTGDQMQRLTAGMQDMLVPMGLARAEAADLSTAFLEIAGDVASFNNVSPDQVLQDIQSGLAGMSRPLRKYGVDIADARLQTIMASEAFLALGIENERAAKAQAIMIAIQEDSADAMGDAARTADSAANSMRFVGREMKELGQNIGTVLIPVVIPLVQKLTAFVKTLADMDPALLKAGVAIAGVAAAIGPLLIGLGFLAKSIVSIKAAVIILTPMFTGLAAAIAAIGWPITLTVAAIAAATLAWMKWGDDIKAIVSSTIEVVREYLVGRLQAIVDSVKAKIDAVTGFFRNMYDRVVGSSYVPDMIDGIALQFARLDAVMVQPAIAATNQVNAAFAGIQLPTLGGQIGQITGALTGALAALSPAGLISGVIGNLAGSVAPAILSPFRNLFGGRNNPIHSLDLLGKVAKETAETLRGVPMNYNIALARHRVAGSEGAGVWNVGRIVVEVDSTTSWDKFRRSIRQAAAGGDPLARQLSAATART